MSGKSEDKNGSAPGPAQSPLSEEERAKILETVLQRMVLIDGKVYGLEDETEPSADVDCKAKISSCRAFCCTYVFALTQEEVRKAFTHTAESVPIIWQRTRTDTVLTPTARRAFAPSMNNVP